ncbi:MAG: hypothetical protein ABW352_10520 [Polyangiales bacterium]
MQRWVQTSLKVAGTLPLALSCASCLVTNELDFQANKSLLTADIVSPRSPYPVPSVTGDECLPSEVSFVARYYYEDVAQPLWMFAFVNGQQLRGLYQAMPNPNGSPEHVPPAICAPRSALQNACNRIEVFVTEDLNLLNTTSPEDLRGEPRVQGVTWYLYGSSTDEEAGGAKPYTSFYDCLSLTEEM